MKNQEAITLIFPIIWENDMEDGIYSTITITFDHPPFKSLEDKEYMQRYCYYFIKSSIKDLEKDYKFKLKNPNNEFPGGECFPFSTQIHVSISGANSGYETQFEKKIIELYNKKIIETMITLDINVYLTCCGEVAESTLRTEMLKFRFVKNDQSTEKSITLGLIPIGGNNIDGS